MSYALPLDPRLSLEEYEKIAAGDQVSVAREHGFASWPEFAEHVVAMARADSPNSRFEAAADAIASGDEEALRKLLAENPDLPRERSTREHRSTLLHYVSANGIEDFRQKTPPNIVEITKMLLDAGADVNAESEAYGGHSTALELTATSVHPEEAGVQMALLRLLLDRGARMDIPQGKSIVTACFANGQPKAAEFLASMGAPLDLEAAAALGRLDIVKSLSNAEPQQLGAAFLYACGNGRGDVVDYLLEKGVDACWQNAEHQTGIHWAAYGGQVELVELLLGRGCPVNIVEARFGGTPLDWALHAMKTAPDRAERCAEVARILKRFGAER